MIPGSFQLGTATTSGYVLTANASGVGTWQAAAGGGGGATFEPIFWMGGMV
jgi:hypothetical protein